MLNEYVQHFTTGDIKHHRESQRHWIKDKAPPVETNLGFLETYLDPENVRAEYEGWVAIVDQKKSEVFGKLVELS